MPKLTTHDAFLAHLVGQWDLTGQMGDTPLHQAVAARWVLGGLFVEMTCRSVLLAAEGEQPYEAVYHIGYNADHDCYMLHLLDTFGVPISCVAARGRREGDSIPFVFDCDSARGRIASRGSRSPAQDLRDQAPSSRRRPGACK